MTVENPRQFANFSRRKVVGQRVLPIGWAAVAHFRRQLCDRRNYRARNPDAAKRRQHGHGDHQQDEHPGKALFAAGLQGSIVKQNIAHPATFHDGDPIAD